MLNALMDELKKGVILTGAVFRAEGGISREDRQSEPCSLEILPMQSTARCDICPCVQQKKRTIVKAEAAKLILPRTLERS